jgi:hypothetical protein
MKGLAKRIRQNAKANLLTASIILETEMHQTVAMDTGALNRSIRTEGVFDKGNTLAAEVGSFGVPYAVYVEKGNGRGVANYQRNGSIVYTGSGMQWAQRSLEKSKPQIMNILKQSFFASV